MGATPRPSFAWYSHVKLGRGRCSVGKTTVKRRQTAQSLDRATLTKEAEARGSAAFERPRGLKPAGHSKNSTGRSRRGDPAGSRLSPSGKHTRMMEARFREFRCLGSSSRPSGGRQLAALPDAAVGRLYQPAGNPRTDRNPFDLWRRVERDTQL